MRFFRRYLGIFILVALVTASTWITLSTENSLHQKNAKKIRVDAYFKNTRYKQFNSTGQLILILNSPYITLNKDQNRLTAEQPKIVAYNQDNSYWLINGNQMATNTKTHVTTLRGDIVLYKPATKKDPNLTLKTDHLTLYPHDKALTDAPVTLWQGNGFETHGVGCVIDLKTNTVKVLSQTNTRVTPSKKNKSPATNNPKQPYYITSDSATLHNETRIVEFFGHVVSTQGKSKSSSNYAKGLSEKSGKIKQIVLTGSPASYSTLSQDDPYPMTATAKTIIDYPKTSIIYMKGNAIALHHSDSIAGDKIWYDKKKGTIKSLALSENPTKTVFTTKTKRI
jgi:LPS export ABC transporter protein LptC/lipopolysaccharide transport protein LptA